MRKITSILFLMSFFFLVIGDSYARRSPRAKKDDKIYAVDDYPETPCEVVEKSVNVTIYDLNFAVPSDRNPAFSCPYYYASPWNSQYGASSLYDSPSSKYYCLVTVATECKSWGQNGIKTFVWTSRSNELEVVAPSNMPYRITVEYYEPCGPYWNDSSVGRGKWMSETTFTGYTPTASFVYFAFITKQNC